MNKAKTTRDAGYSLVEILVTLAIAGLVTAAIYSAFQSQQKSYIVQDQVAEMQQNLRAAIDMMEREIRMAGCDPTGNAGATIVSAGPTSIHFTMDITDKETNISDNSDNDHDGKIDETADIPDGNTSGHDEEIKYKIYDAYGDGNMDLGRYSNTVGYTMPVAENIDNLEFYYTMDDGTKTLNPPEPSKIRTVQISLLARTSKPDQAYTDTHVYITASGAVWGPFNDHYRRRLIISTIKCRNMGL